ncbi:hypothetical protein HY500_02285 [Candidatus Woesearchaeota archaeon]|nr:hypothetical protein [Candidatus Woesearchaeota archaeon]
MEEDIFSNDRLRVKRALLRGMCNCAEMVREYYEAGTICTNMHFLDGCPKPFKPNVADKFLFGTLIDRVLDNIMSESRDYTNEDIAGMVILGRYYYPFYERD